MPELYDKNGDPVEVYDEEGNPLDEVLSPDEVEEKINEAKEEIQEELKGSTEEETQILKERLDDKIAELEETKENLQKEQGKDKNFSRLRGKTEDREKEITELQGVIKDLTEKVEKIDQSGEERNVNLKIATAVKGDEELTKKVKFFYDQFNGSPKDDNEVQERIKNSIILATGAKGEDVLSGDVVSFGGGSTGQGTTKTGKISEESKGLAGKLGIEDRELKRHKLI